MKIYFNGCSWTFGAELENKREERFSRLVCKVLDAEETNDSKAGGSNDRIIRKMMYIDNFEEYDLAVIQMTYPARTEYWDKNTNEWIRVNPKYNFSRWLTHQNHDTVKDERARVRNREVSPFYARIDTLHKKFKNHGNHWMYYYKNVHTENYSRVKERIQYETIKSYCISKGVPLIICSINEWSKLNFDFLLTTNRDTRAKKGHPNKLGHLEIANLIVNKWKTIK